MARHVPTVMLFGSRSRAPGGPTWSGSPPTAGASRRAPVVGVPLGGAGAEAGAELPRRSAITRTPGSTTSWRSSSPRSTGSRATPRATARPATWRPRSPSWHNADPPGRGPPEPVREGVGDAARLTRARGAVAAFDDLLGRPVSMRALALLRVLAGPVVLLHLRPFLVRRLDGRIYRDAFYEPYAAWYPELPERGLRRRCSGWRRWPPSPCRSGCSPALATATTFAIVAYNLFLSTTHFHNNRAYLVIVLGLLAVAPCGRELSLDAWLRRRRGRPALDRGAGLAAVAAAVRVRRDLRRLGPEQAPRPRLVRRHRHLAARRARPRRPGGVAAAGLGVSLLTDRSFHTGAAKVIVLTELFIAVGLWWRAHPLRGRVGRRRLPRAIEVSASVQVFSFLGIAVLVVWAVPSTRDRVLRIDPAIAATGVARWCAGSTGWPASASSRRRPARRSRSWTGMAPRSAARRPWRSRSAACR